MVQHVIVGLIVAAMVAWLVWTLARRVRSGGCDCEAAESCPYAADGSCDPSAPISGEEEADEQDPDTPEGSDRY